MKIVIIGYGKMGRLIEDFALQKEYTILGKPYLNETLTSEEEKLITQADVCIDFSHPQAVIHHVKTLANLNKNIVMGTTGWYEHIHEVKRIVHAFQIGFIFSPNFSLGVHLFKNMIESAAQLINEFEEYDVAGYELHHNQKIDNPSGTAKSIVYTLLEKIKRKTMPIYDLANRPINSHELHFPSIRCGSEPGTHAVIFDSPADTITLTHRARNREGFARGALAAAEWIKGKKGFFTMDDMIHTITRIPNEA